MTSESGTDVIRAALQAHSHSSLNLGVVARDLGVSTEALTAFLDGRLTPSADTLQALTKILFHNHAVLDSQRNVLRPAMQEPVKSIGLAPAPVARKPVGHTGAPPLYPPTGNKKPAWQRKWA
jgi:hypothetical protein